jgi:endonuclease G
MSKTTIAIAAAIGALTGATFTGFLFSGPKSGSNPLPPAQARKFDEIVGPVDPAGVFNYGFPGPVYARSGYDRGHQVPAADAKFTQEAMDETFFLSNMCPQVGEGFNRDYWAHFEDFGRRLTQKYASVRIITGPLYLPKLDPVDNKWRVSYEVIGTPANVAVPTHFFKVFFGEDGTTGGDVAIGAFVLPNAAIPNSKPLTDFVVPLEAIERASGLTFADNLPAIRRKALCREIECSIVARSFENSQRKYLGPPSGRSQTVLKE